MMNENSYDVLDLLHKSQSVREPVTRIASTTAGRRPVCGGGSPSGVVRTAARR